MSTKVRPLDRRTREIFLGSCQAMFLHGGCYEFAVAMQLHGKEKWPIVGIVKGDHIPHVALKVSESRFFDGRGFFPREEIGNEHGYYWPCELREVDVEDLRALNPIRETLVDRAVEFLELLWPDVLSRCPHLERMLAFAKALEELSMAHGIYIRSPSFQARSTLEPMLEEDPFGGYTIEPIGNGGGFLLDRHFQE